MPSHPDATEAYCAIILRRDATEILLLTGDAGWTLPLVEIQTHQRVAEQITQEIRKSWGLETCLLLAPSSGAYGSPAKAASVVLECAQQNQRPPSGTHWMPAEAALACCGMEGSTIQDAFAELATYTSGDRPGPFAKPGWLRELFRWVYEQTAPLKLRLTGGFRQFNASPTFSLVRLETDGGALWFKATGEPNAQELPITLLLANRFPSHLPRILGVHSSWNGWLSCEAEGTALDELTDCPSWEQAAEGLGELQIASVGKATELVDGKCKDLRLPLASRQIGPFVTRMEEFMRVQENHSPAPLTGTELLSLGEGLQEAFSLLQSFDFPDTLGHLDCNPGNLIVSRERCVFLDWAEACVTHPVITFEYLRRHMERCRIEDPAADSRITGAYFRRWAAFVSPDDLRRAIAAAPPAAVFLHAIASDAWRTVDPVSNPAIAAYFRSLTRRMYRDAVLAAERSERCLN